jgi:hypothetical protein
VIVVKVTPSSKVVGDMLMMVSQNLTRAQKSKTDSDVSFPDSVVGHDARQPLHNPPVVLTPSSKKGPEGRKAEPDPARANILSLSISQRCAELAEKLTAHRSTKT